MDRKKYNILGVYYLGHNSTAYLVRDGNLIACCSEERFNRIKNCLAFPKNAIDFILKSAGINYGDIDLIVIPLRHTYGLIGIPNARGEVSKIYKMLNLPRKLWKQLEFRVSFLRPLLRKIFVHFFHGKKGKPLNEMRKYISEILLFPFKKIICIEHHFAHAYTAYKCSHYLPEDKVLVFTLDGGGDGLCASVSIAQGGVLKRIDEITADNSIGQLYSDITRFLGMKPLEHEYKVMGLAPYAHEEAAAEVYNILKDLIDIDKNNHLRFCSKIGTYLAMEFIRNKLTFYRFDAIAGGLQRLTEELIVKWINNVINSVNIHKIVLSGGVFMNVKANMALTKLPAVEDIFILPSPDDSSTTMGAALYGWELLTKENKMYPIKNVYLGPNFKNEDIQKIIYSIDSTRNWQKIFIQDIEAVVGELLSRGYIVAHFCGRMEFGARALGNRSILADPSKSELVRVINDQIKGRDFWMPFAPTILQERAKDYISNPKEIKSPFMMMAFETTDLGKKHLKSAMHPYDYTVRAQILMEKDNPRYYRLIKEFEKTTGIGAVLNTSFNIHGEPIVCTPNDALDVFSRSGLQILVLENYLISKIKVVKK